jgi:hypothetical protein
MPLTKSTVYIPLRRLSDLATIRRAIAVRMPELCRAAIGLKEIAEFCRRHVLAYPGKDWHEMRDEILTIGCEWDLARDSLSQQPEACLAYLARFLMRAATWAMPSANS